MGLTLFTLRIVINALGVEDFGIYSVVASLVTMFSFMNAAMSSSTFRQLSFNLGINDTKKLQQVFSAAVNVHLVIALLSYVLAKIGGFVGD